MTAPHQEALLVVWGINVMTAPHQEGLLVLRGINVMMAPHPNCPTLDDVVESFPVVGGGIFSNSSLYCGVPLDSRAVIAWGPAASGPPCNCSHYS